MRRCRLCRGRIKTGSPVCCKCYRRISWLLLTRIPISRRPLKSPSIASWHGQLFVPEILCTGTKRDRVSWGLDWAARRCSRRFYATIVGVRKRKLHCAPFGLRNESTRAGVQENQATFLNMRLRFSFAIPFSLCVGLFVHGASASHCVWIGKAQATSVFDEFSRSSSSRTAGRERAKSCPVTA